MFGLLFDHGAELWGLHHGLHIARDSGLPRVMMESDSHMAIHFVTEVLMSFGGLQLNWRRFIGFMYSGGAWRFGAKHGLSSPSDLTIFSLAPSCISVPVLGVSH